MQRALVSPRPRCAHVPADAVLRIPTAVSGCRAALLYVPDRAMSPQPQPEAVVWQRGRSTRCGVPSCSTASCRRQAAVFAACCAAHPDQSSEAPAAANPTSYAPSARATLASNTGSTCAASASPSVPADTYYPHIVWMAMEPRVAADPTPFFPLLAANDNSVSAYCARRVMRRICDLTDATARAKHLDAAMQWLADNATKTGVATAALDGLIEATKSKGAPPTVPLEPIFAKLSSNPALADKAQRLAAAFGDKSAALCRELAGAAGPLSAALRGLPEVPGALPLLDEVLADLGTILTGTVGGVFGSEVIGKNNATDGDTGLHLGRRA